MFGPQEVLIERPFEQIQQAQVSVIEAISKNGKNLAGSSAS